MTPACPAVLELERYLNQESTPDRVHLETCPQCVARLATMRAEGDRYLGSTAAQRVREKMAARPPKASTRWWHKAIWIGVPALVAAAVVVIVARPPDDGALHPKGAGVLGLTVERDGVTFGWEGEQLRLGDRVQPIWTESVDGEVVLFGCEKNGECTVLFPLAGQKSARVRRGRAVALGDSVTLDRPLQLCLLSARQRFDLTGPLKSLEGTGAVSADQFSGQVSTLELAPSR